LHDPLPVREFHVQPARIAAQWASSPSSATCRWGTS
jgi:hypothetical protein